MKIWREHLRRSGAARACWTAPWAARRSVNLSFPTIRSNIWKSRPGTGRARVTLIAPSALRLKALRPMRSRIWNMTGRRRTASYRLLPWRWRRWPRPKISRSSTGLTPSATPRSPKALHSGVSRFSASPAVPPRSCQRAQWSNATIRRFISRAMRRSPPCPKTLSQSHLPTRAMILPLPAPHQRRLPARRPPPNGKCHRL